MMGTFVFVHVVEPPCTEEMVRRFLGLDPQGEQAAGDGGNLARLAPSERKIVLGTPGVGVGVSDYFAERVDEALGRPPDPRRSVHSLFRRRALQTIDEELIATVAEILQARADPLIGPRGREEVLAFLRGHLGKKAFAAAWEAGDGPPVRREAGPKTVDEAVDVVLSWLTDEEKEAILRNEPSLGESLFALGVRIRAELGLWGGNPELEEALTRGVMPYNVDELTDELLKEVQRRLRVRGV